MIIKNLAQLATPDEASLLIRPLGIAGESLAESVAEYRQRLVASFDLVEDAPESVNAQRAARRLRSSRAAESAGETASRSRAYSGCRAEDSPGEACVMPRRRIAAFHSLAVTGPAGDH